MFRIILFLPFLFLAACSSKYPQDGGPCTYVTDTVAATIVRMDSAGAYPDIVLQVTRANGDLDSIRYSSNTGESPTWEMCAQRGYIVGAKLKTIHQLRTGGHCDPEYFVVKKELYP